MTQDHIKLRWLQEFLEGIEFLQPYHWTTYTDEDDSESIADGGLYDVELTYDIILHIQEYTRSSIELRRILLHWLEKANVSARIRQSINLQYKQIDTDRHDVQAIFTVTETQQDIICDQAESEGRIWHNDQWVYIKLNREKPDELVNLESILCTGKLDEKLTQL